MHGACAVACLVLGLAIVGALPATPHAILLFVFLITAGGVLVLALLQPQLGAQRALLPLHCIPSKLKAFTAEE
jgi:hypothetical protein